MTTPATWRIAAEGPEAVRAHLATLAAGPAPGSHAVGEGPVRLAIVDPTPRKAKLADRLVEAGEPWGGRSDVWFSPSAVGLPSGLGGPGGKVAFLFPGVEPTFGAGGVDLPALATRLGLTAPDVTEDTVAHRSAAIVRLGIFLDAALRRLGVVPDLVGGHSIGEWSATVSAGLATPEAAEALITSVDLDAVELPAVDFAALVAGADDVAAALRDAGALLGPGGVEVSHDNCSRQSVICGPPDLVASAMAVLGRRNILGQVLDFRSGFHTSALLPALGVLRGVIDAFPLRESRTTPIWSATTCAPLPDDLAEARDVITRHLVEPVRFRGLVENMYEAGARVFVQPGIGNLVGFVDDILDGRPHAAIPVVTAKRPALAQLHRALTALWSSGIDSLPLPHPAAPPPLSGSAAVAEEPPHSPDPSSGPAPTPAAPATAPTRLSGRAVVAGQPAHSPEPASAPAPTPTTPATPPTPLSGSNVVAGQPAHSPEPASASAPAPAAAATETPLPVLGRNVVAQQPHSSPESDGASTSRRQPVPTVAGPSVAGVARAGESNGGVGGAAASVGTAVVGASPGGGGAHGGEAGGSGGAAVLAGLGAGSVAEQRIQHPQPPAGSGAAIHPVLAAAAGVIHNAQRATQEIVAAWAAAPSGRPAHGAAPTTAQRRQVLVAPQAASSPAGTAGAIPAPGIGAAGTRGGKLAAGGAGAEEGDGAYHPGGQVPAGGGGAGGGWPSGRTSVVRRVSLEALPETLDHTLYRQPEGWPDVSDRFPIVAMTSQLEILADIARGYAPGRDVVELSDVRNYRWLDISEPVDLDVTIVPEGDDVLRIALGPYCRAKVRVGAFPAPVPHERAPLRSPRPARKVPDQLWEERLMFHGPRFHGIRSLGPVGEDGMYGELEGMADPGTLLDNVGKLIAYWTMEQNGWGEAPLPIGVSSVRFDGPGPEPGEPVPTDVRIVDMDDDFIVGEAVLCRADGTVWCRIEGWRMHIFHRDEKIDPLTRWVERFQAIDVEDDGLYLQYERWPGTPTRDLFSHQSLRREERATYESMTPVDRRAWLLEVVAVKEATRRWLADRFGITSFPVQVDARPVDGGDGDGTDGRWVATSPLAPGAELHVALSRHEWLVAAVTAEAEASDDNGGGAARPPLAVALRPVPEGDDGEALAAALADELGWRLPDAEVHHRVLPPTEVGGNPAGPRAVAWAAPSRILAGTRDSYRHRHTEVTPR